jgi:hypothetical protein
MKRVALGVLRLYKATVSRYMPGMCRYQPTCSEYAAGAIERYGALRGTWMAVRRMARCQPWGKRGYDPVPGLE